MALNHDPDARPVSDAGESSARARHREDARLRREDMLSKVRSNPRGYVHAVESRMEGDGDIVVHVATTMEKARAYCSALPDSEYGEDVRMHIIPHLLDADIADTESGTISIAVYGVRPGENGAHDLVGTDDE